MGNKNTIITYGTFDLLHVGHIRLLKCDTQLEYIAKHTIMRLQTCESIAQEYQHALPSEHKIDQNSASFLQTAHNKKLKKKNNDH